MDSQIGRWDSALRMSKAAAGAISLLPVLLFGYFFGDAALRVSAGGYAFLGNAIFLLTLPILEMVALLAFGVRWVRAHRRLTAVLWRLGLIGWPCSVANVLFVAYLVGNGALF